jgi:hypothetical protein
MRRLQQEKLGALKDARGHEVIGVPENPEEWIRLEKEIGCPANAELGELNQ